jgi:hypothetical protein
MAYQQGLASAGLRMIRYGSRYVMDPNASEPATFTYEVGARYERWAEGMVIIHNPSALRPLPLEILPEALHHELIEGRVISTIPPSAPFNSLTFTVVAGS